MLTASRSLGRAVETGRPLPEVPGLEDLYRGYFRCRPRRGQVCLIAGQPGAGKSGLALWWVDQMNIPALYHSADMAPHTAVTRLAAIRTGDAVSEVSEGLAGAGDAYYAAALESSKIRFCFDPNPTLDTIYEEIEAWVELTDSFPQVIVIDNLMDVLGDGDNETAIYKAVLLEAKTIARETGAAVFVLHHMSEAAGHPDDPPARKFILGKAAQTPEVILSVALGSPASSRCRW
ncbi:hypothetical protein DDP54_15740 (plasmid) [Cellulomonas sp. WB94]|uniref:AAA family ATPase n=1 Tax=Cellulomonas sp. WB94 TaxID=2173174 RepID=UPI000D581765|nr:AAA family ATPase [Cellulomonas sp. WB94]PVU81351.1 hypothetical protein DDP54_15740 [Cellulomonas sp. WB94]